jgi:hypothetical protein
MISFTTKGSFDRTIASLKKLSSGEIFRVLDRYGAMGQSALASATPVDSGLTAQSWSYKIIQNGRYPGIEWYNTNTNNGFNVAISLQYGHGTGTGGYVQGRDYINPAIMPIFNQISQAIEGELRRA